MIINALTERTEARTGLITTRGFRDILEVGRANRPDLYNLTYRKPRPFVPRHLRLEVTERVTYRGEVQTPLDEEEVRQAVLYLGRVVEEGPTDRLFAAPRHPYTQMLLSAVPVVSEEEERIKPRWEAPVGEAPSAVALPTGCVFHPRCPFAWEVCAVQDPAAVMVGPAHAVRCHLYDPALTPTRSAALS